MTNVGLIRMICFVICFSGAVARSEEWPMFGRDATHNAVSPEKDPPRYWDVGRTDRRTGRLIDAGENIRWRAALGSNTFGDPVVSSGLVWVGTNNSRLSSGEEDWEDASLLMCFRERDGRLLYKYVSPRMQAAWIIDCPMASLACSPLIEGDRLWFTTNRFEVVCLDIGPLLRSQGEPRELWKVDLIERFGIQPFGPYMGWTRGCSVAAYGDCVYVVAQNGFTEFPARNLPRPDAPSLVCLDKKTGETRWTNSRPGSNILYGQWTTPLAVEIDGRAQVIAGQGDGWLRSFDPISGTLLWEFDMNPKAAKWGGSRGGRGTRNCIMATPVLRKGRIYLATGLEESQGDGPGRLCCIDPTKSGDISAELVINKDGDSVPHRRILAVDTDKGERSIPNPNSGLHWEFTKRGDDAKDEMGRTLSNVAVEDGLVIAPTLSGIVHCLDAGTGEKFWSYDTYDDISSSPLIVDRSVYVTSRGAVWVFGLSSRPDVAMDRGEPIVVDLDRRDVINCSPIFVNGTLYIAGRNLYAIRSAADSRSHRNRRSSVSSPNGEKSSRFTEQLHKPGRRQTPDAVYVPTPQDVVEKMLQLAELTKDDVLCDLGSGDGRIVITAAKKYGSQAIGYEIDPALVALSRENLNKAEVNELVAIENADVFTRDLSDKDVITVFLYPGLLERLVPQFRKLKPGSRIVSHHFLIPGYTPDTSVRIQSADSGDTHTIHLWHAPLSHETESSESTQKPGP